MTEIDTRIDTILNRRVITNNIQPKINGITTGNEHHRMNEEIQATGPTQAIEEACLDNDTITTIGTPSTHAIEDHHETIDPLEIDLETATAVILATIAREQEVNRLIVLISHRQVTDDRLRIQYNSMQNNIPLLFKIPEKNGQ